VRRPTAIKESTEHDNNSNMSLVSYKDTPRTAQFVDKFIGFTNSICQCFSEAVRELSKFDSFSVYNVLL
jgi:hypothetical protein